MYKSDCPPPVPLLLISTPVTCCNRSATLVAALFLMSLAFIIVIVREFFLNGKLILEELITIESNS